MDDKSYVRIPKKWVHTGLVVAVTAAIVAPLAAVASHSFTDVPNTNTFHEDIAWLADAGVTRGCNPPSNTEFCPDDEVTREQMAAFMRRFAQYLGAEGGTPAQAHNADLLDGVDGSDFLQAGEAPSIETVAAVGTDVFEPPETVPTNQLAVDRVTAEFTTAQSGILRLNLSGLFSADCSSGTPWSWIELDGEPIESSLARVNPGVLSSYTLIGVSEGSVPAGNHEMSLGAGCDGTFSSATTHPYATGTVVVIDG